MHWQARVHYYWYKKIKAQCEAKGKCQMGGFTRLLHSGKADDLMDEIPSYVVNPLPPDKQDHKGYVVLNRPYAFAQWTQQVKIKEKYVIMSEPDHVWLKPMPNLMKVQLLPVRSPRLLANPPCTHHQRIRGLPRSPVVSLQGRRPAAFPFFYIEPSKKEFLHITEKFTGPLTTQQAETIAPIGTTLGFRRISASMRPAVPCNKSYTCRRQCADDDGVGGPRRGVATVDEHLALDLQ